MWIENLATSSQLRPHSLDTVVWLRKRTNGASSNVLMRKDIVILRSLLCIGLVATRRTGCDAGGLRDHAACISSWYVHLLTWSRNLTLPDCNVCEDGMR